MKKTSWKIDLKNERFGLDGERKTERKKEERREEKRREYG